MKRIRIEQGRLTAYINQDDVEMLTSIKEVVPNTFFEQEMVKRGYGDENGIYRIGELCAVNYIKAASFIPNEDCFDKLNLEEIEHIYNDSIEEMDKLIKILRKLYSKMALTDEEKQLLQENCSLKSSLVEEAQKKAFIENDERQEARFIAVNEALAIQCNYYVSSIGKYLEAKKEKEKENPKPKSKTRKFSFKHLFERNKHY